MADSRKYSTDIDLQGNSIINGGFEQVVALPLNGYDGQTVSYRGKLYTWYNGQWNCIADDLGGVEETREERFTFQPTANDESVKDGLAIVKSIKGNTVVANQLFKKNLLNPITGISVTYDNGKFTVNGTTDATNSVYLDKDYTQYKQGDKILMLYPHNKPNPYGNFVAMRSASKFYHCPNNVDAYIVTITETENLRPAFICHGNRPYEDIQFSLQIVNLTQMFGAGNEPTVEEFERLYPNLPKGYNEGSLLNLNADSIKSVGLNAFNGEYAKVLGGMQYYLGANITSLTFKENLEDEGETIEIPSDKLYTPTTNGYLVASGDNICINLSHSGYRNGEYEPYRESIANLPIETYFPDGMKSVGSVKDEIIWDESIKKYKAIKKVGSVDMGTLEWSFYDSSEKYSPFFFVRDSVIKSYSNIITEKYYFDNDLVYTRDKIISTVPYIINGNIIIRDNDYAYDANGLESFKQSLQGQMLYYELATPVETIIDDYDLIDYEVSDFGTEEILSDEPTTPIVADIQYGFNAVDEIRNHRFEIRDLKKLISRGLNLNGVTVHLGDTSTIPAYITYNGVLYPIRIQDNWLQIYRNEVWGNLFNLASEVIPSLYIEEFEGDWYNPNILEYILSDELTTKLISETLDFRSILTSIQGFAGVKLSLQSFSPKEYDKSLANILNALTGYVVYVENDIDTMFNSGNNVLVKLNFDTVNRVTIECYIQR